MPRLLTLLLALVLTIGVLPGASPSPVAAGDNESEEEEEEQSLDAFVSESAIALNTYWGGLFQAAGLEYAAPAMVVAGSTERVRSLCGRSRGVSHSYCPAERTVYLDYDSEEGWSLESLWDDDRALAMVWIMAHEWGHHIQNLLGLYADDQANPRSSTSIELQADCLAGLFVRTYGRAVEWVADADLEDTAELVSEAGDVGVPASQMTHGSPAQRVAAFQTGYGARGLAACGL
jgi:predicted metalloprotease